MKNKLYHLIILFCLSGLLSVNAFSNEPFNFDVTEIQILDKGNIIKGIKKGKIKTDNDVIIEANTFTYNKITNILNAEGNVIINDLNRDIIIYSENIIYNKNKEIIETNINSKAVYSKNKIIKADIFIYNKNKNIILAKGNVEAEDIIKNNFIFTEFLTYNIDQEKLTTKGKTIVTVGEKYKILSEDVIYLSKENNLSSDKKTRIEDNKSQIYNFNTFNFSISQEILSGEEVLIITNYNLPNSDKFYFNEVILDLKNQKFVAKNTNIEIHKNIFDNSENDPRLKGVSSKGDQNFVKINKGIFTSCKKNDKCPPWSIQAEKIEHDKNKKQLNYENAVLRIYDVPVLYFPKFFHPDPTVERQSGLLKPEINQSNILGSSITLPYFKVLSKNKDLTFKPTWFDQDILMTQGEYRQINRNSSLIADIGLVNNYTSSSDKKKKNLSHLFVDYKFDLELQNYLSSDLNLSIQRTTNDSYLKIFENHITKSKVRPDSLDKLNNNIKLFLNHQNFNFETGFETYETLKTKKSDRYQYILPYYNYEKYINQNKFDGFFTFNSNGSNSLNDTNSLETNIINDISYNSNNFISNMGLNSSYSIDFKNLNSIGKKTSKYKSSPQIELLSVFNANLSLPLIKENENYINLFTPKLSLRFNPSDMKNNSSSKNKVDVNNIFAINRLGLSDTLESGKSLTVGFDFTKEKKNGLDEINNYFEFKLATVFREDEENFIPNQSTLNKKNSNLFGSLKNKFSDNIDLEYNFSIDNDYSTFENNDLNLKLSLNNIVTEFNFIEENGEVGDANVLTNSITYQLDNKNSFKFDTRRNRKINLTEYYDLVYEYKNDCLTAGVKYRKTYYSDGDLKPSENLLFTITLFPLTTYEYNAEELLEN